MDISTLKIDFTIKNKNTGLPVYTKIDKIIYKTCSKCKESKPLNDENFYINNRKGKKIIPSLCKTCKRINPINDEGNVLCMCCKKYLDKNEFKDSFLPRLKNRNFKKRHCINCVSQKRKNSRKNQKPNLKSFLHNKFFAATLRTKSKNKNRIFFDINIDEDYLYYLYNLQKGKCAISGVEMTYIEHNGNIPTNISIDRLNSNLGYIKENVHLVCNIVNIMKNTMTVEELKYWCNLILNNN